MNSDIILDIQNVTKKYKNQTVLDKVSFAMKKGEIIGLVGPNGAGKTTLMGIIVGLIKNYDGDIFVNGQNVRKHQKTTKKQVGCVIESPGFYPNLTGYQNLRFFCEVFGGVDISEINDIVKLLGLEKSIHKKCKKYSLGMKQRLGIAQAVLGYPKLLILDEPTNGLDANVIPHIREFIKYVSEQKGISVLVSSHILTEIEQMCDKVIFMKNGNIFEELNLKKLNDNNNSSFIFETDKVKELAKFFSERSVSAEIESSEIVRANVMSEEIELMLPQIINEGINIRSMYKQKVNLEERFIKSMGENTIE